MDEKYQQDYPNSNYLTNLNNLNRTNQSVDLNRLPTLGEILSNRTKSPVDLFTFYKFMKEIENKVEYLDFWFDLVNHLNLCKYYVKGLRNSLLKQQTQIQRQLNQPSEGNIERTGQRTSNFLENHKSLSSSVLLDMIINDDILQDNDSNRLSQFLRGDLNVSDPKLADLINQYEEDYENHYHSGSTNYRNSNASQFVTLPNPDPNVASPQQQHYDEHFRPPSGFSSVGVGYGTNSYGSGSGEKRVSSNSKLIDNSNDEYYNNTGFQPPQPQTNTGSAGPHYTPLKRDSSLNPSLLERLARDPNTVTRSSGSFVTRNNLKESTQNLLLKYFVDDSEKNLNLPANLNNHIIKSIEIDGRDDPDIFNHVKSFVFNRIENEHLPNFLNFIAIKNLNSNFIRIILGLFFIFIGFWIGYTLIFLNYAKSIRVPVLVPFLIGSYCIISAIYLIDPILVWIRRSQSFQESKRFIRIDEPFIFKLLFKRSLWVTFLILLMTAILTIIFCLVPGHRL